MSVQNQRVVADLEFQPFRHGVLQFLDAAVHELLHPAAVHTHDMIVVGAVIEFENRHAAFEMMPGDQPGRLELGEHPINRSETDVLVRFQQCFINILGAHVARRPVGEYVENFQTRKRDLESRVPQVIAFTRRGAFEALRHAVTRYDKVRLSTI